MGVLWSDGAHWKWYGGSGQQLSSTRGSPLETIDIGKKEDDSRILRICDFLPVRTDYKLVIKQCL